jgi:Protein phosphatase 2C
MWTVIGASVAGTLHQATGRQCEDACGWRAATGVACLAVADGAGSRSMSRCGAALAVESSLLACAEGPCAEDTVAVGQIGDTIAVAGRAGGYQTLTPAPRAEYVNETAFLTGPDAPGELRINLTPAAQADTVFLATDGLRFKILDDLATASPFAPFFEDLAAFARSPQASDDAVRAFLAGLDDQSGDDKTLVAAVRD